MPRRIEFNRPAQYELHSAASALRTAAEVSLRRTIKGPLRPSWTLSFEVATKVLKRHLVTAFAMHNVKQARLYLDSFVINLAELSDVNITRSPSLEVKGSWFVPKRIEPRCTLLYLHGGGYSFYPKSYVSLIGEMSLIARARIFALDYRLSPEFRFPAQLHDAMRAYRHLLENGVSPREMVIAGDSAGGNLTLALLLSLHDAGLPLPALAVLLSPAADFMTPTELGGRPSLLANEKFDYITREMLLTWADWFCGSESRTNPLVSPIYADLRGLPPIYVQAGRAEILYDSIQAFVECARRQGADVVFESWDDMNHDFQMFGPLARQSVDAIRRIGEVIGKHLPARQNVGTQ
jgi:epsilon-lactone hydrolase